MSSKEQLGYEVVDRIAVITVNRPEKRNAMTFEMVAALKAAIHAAEDDDEVVACLIRGAGGHFTSGMDLTQAYSIYADREGQGEDRKRRPAQRTRLRVDEKEIAKPLEAVQNCLKPVIVRAEGFSLGFGTFLIIACDACIASDDAEIGFPEEKVGFSGAMPMLASLILTVGLKRARGMLMLGRALSGKEAAEIGLVTQSVPAAQLDAATQKMLDQVRKLPKDGVAIGRVATRMALEDLGASRQTMNWSVLHTLFTNIRYEEGEFNLVRSRDKGGMKAVVGALRKDGK